MARTPNYVVGRGKLYFDKFLTGTKTVSGNERYLGNSPELSMSQDEETLDHYSSDSGIKVKDATVELQNDASMSFALDDISKENLALWFRGEAQDNALAAVVGATTTVDAVSKGSYIQLGLTAGNPIGSRNVSNVVVTNVTQANAVVVMAGNYEVDAVTGRVYVLDDAPDIDEDDELSIAYDSALGTEEVVIAQNEIIEGRMVFIADNAAGENRDYIWPYVRVRPDGDFSLKGDEWQQMSFGGEILKLNDSTERQYIVRR
jgi:hypothetical protein